MQLHILGSYSAGSQMALTVGDLTHRLEGRSWKDARCPLSFLCFGQGL